jgi:hypothetical protein
MNAPKVNIGQRSLQAVIRDVGNPQSKLRGILKQRELMI